SGEFTHRSLVSSQLSLVQAFPSSQLRGTPPEHDPPWHASLTVQNWPSSHPAPSASAGWGQVPAEHPPAVPGVPSSAPLPLRLVKTQPGAGSQVSVVHSLPSLHVRGAPGWQVPAPSQVSFSVQALLSLHAVPAPAGVCGWQPPVGSHGSSVQGLLSLQLRGAPGTHVPLAHRWLPLHPFPSEHDVPSATGTWRQPSEGEHESEVHTLASLQFSTWQKTEQPSQLWGVPAVSQVSGNSTTPLPQ